MKIRHSFINKNMFLGLLVNKIIPLDKITILLYIFYNKCIRDIRLSKNEKQCIFLIYLIPFISYIINFPDASLQIFYPSFFLTGAILGSKFKISPLWIRSAIFINVLIGIVAVILAFMGYENDFSYSLREKALPFIYAPYGLSPTQQVFGTLCILALIISFEFKKYDFIFYVTLLATVLTLNRCTLLFLFLILFLYKRKIFYTITLSIIAVIATYWDIFSNILFSTATLDSRVELRKGAEISFWQSGELMTYIFGRGDSNTTEAIAAKTLHGRTYIEHGLDFVVHCYGFLGCMVVVGIILTFLYYLVKKRQWKYVLICSFYMLFEQFLTHELLASSFFFFFLTILLLAKRKERILL